MPKRERLNRPGTGRRIRLIELCFFRVKSKRVKEEKHIL